MANIPNIGSIRPQIDLNPQPKTRFREQADNISRHRALLEMRECERALDFAALQFIRETAAAVVDANSALAAGYKLAGALEFVRAFRTLSEQPSVAQTRYDDNLSTNKA